MARITWSIAAALVLTAALTSAFVAVGAVATAERVSSLSLPTATLEIIVAVIALVVALLALSVANRAARRLSRTFRASVLMGLAATAALGVWLLPARALCISVVVPDSFGSEFTFREVCGVTSRFTFTGGASGWWSPVRAPLEVVVAAAIALGIALVCVTLASRSARQPAPLVMRTGSIPVVTSSGARRSKRETVSAQQQRQQERQQQRRGGGARRARRAASGPRRSGAGRPY